MEECRDLLLRRAAGTYFLLDLSHPEDARVRKKELNETAAEMFTALSGDMTTEQLAERMNGEYGISKEEALSDIASFLCSIKDFKNPEKE